MSSAATDRETIRLDLFLKASRLAKRRTQAQRMCSAGLVTLDGRPGKAGRKVSPGCRISLRFPGRELLVEVLQLPRKGLRKDEASGLYSVLADRETDPDGHPSEHA